MRVGSVWFLIGGEGGREEREEGEREGGRRGRREREREGEEDESK